MIKKYFSLESWLNVSLYLGFIVIILMMATSLYITINRSAAIKNISQFVHEQRIPQTVNLLKLEQNLTLSLSQLNEFLITGEKNDEQKFRLTIEKILKGLKQTSEITGIQSTNYMHIKQLIDDYRLKSNHIIELKNDRPRNYVGISAASELLNPIYREYINILEQLITEELQNEDDLNLEVLSSLVKTRSSWYRMIMSLRVYFTTKGKLDYQQFQLYLAQNQQDMEDLSSIKDYMDFNLVFVEELEELHAKYLVNLPKVLKVYQEDKWRNDIYILKTEVYPLMSEIQERLRKVIDKSEKVTSEQIDLIQTEMNEQTKLSQFIFFFSLILGIIIVLVVGRNVSKITRSLIRSRGEASRNLKQAEKRSQQLELASKELQNSIFALKDAQEQLIENEKMAALGGLVAGIAHEINTPIGISITSSTFLGDTVTQIKKVYESGEMMESDFNDFLEHAEQSTSILHVNLKRAADLISSFKQIAVDQTSEDLRRFELKTYIDEIVLSLKPKLKKKAVPIEIECPEKIEINSYPGVFSQIMTNLIMNSLIHGYEKKETGIIHINVKLMERKNSYGMVQLIYSDDGQGMSEEVKNKIFEPFYTTKRSKGGSGIGMSLVYNLITQKLGGRITITSEIDKGTRFVIYLPLDIEQTVRIEPE